MTEPTIARRVLGALVGAVLGAVGGVAFTLVHMFATLSLYSPYYHTEPMQAFRVDLVIAAVTAVFGALPDLKHRKGLFAIATLIVIDVYVGTFDVWVVS